MAGSQGRMELRFIESSEQRSGETTKWTRKRLVSRWRTEEEGCGKTGVVDGGRKKVDKRDNA